MHNILVVEDELKLANILEFNFKKEGYNVTIADNGADALNLVINEGKEFDLILLDIMLPKVNGFDVCKTIRSNNNNVPIIMLTAKAEEVDKILGFEFGVDDYITKPFSIREVMARIKANIRRSKITVEKAETEKNSTGILKFDNLKINLNKYEVTINDVEIDLTTREFELLKYLIENKDFIMTREQLLENVWGYEYFGDVRTVDVTIRRLRSKLENDADEPKFILTKRGVGYYFNYNLI